MFCSAIRLSLLLSGALAAVAGCRSSAVVPEPTGPQAVEETPAPGAQPRPAGPGGGTAPGTGKAPAGGENHSEGGQRRVIYQLVVRTFGNTQTARITDGTVQQNGVGKFADINEAALAGLRELGVTDIWLTGVLRQATLTDHSDVGLPADDADIVKGRAGSFYAIRDYFDVSPDYATDKAKRLEEFDALVQRIHAAGMKVHIDLVPNHVARSYASVVRPELDFGKDDDRSRAFSPNNNFYYLPGQGPLVLSRPSHWKPAGVTFDGRFAPEDASSISRTPKVTGLGYSRVANPPHDDWYETIKLNYGMDLTNGAQHFEPRPSTWTKLDAVIAYWQARGVDGFRCDFAHVVPNEAWRYLISQARERKRGTYFFAEAYTSLDGLIALRDSGFDAIYHDNAVDELKRMYLEKSTPDGFASVMGQLDDAVRGNFLHYLENHDERRVASPLVKGDNADDTGFGGMAANYQLAPLLFLYSNGPVLLYNGQEVGETGAGNEGFSGEDGRTSIFDYTSSPELVKWNNGHTYDGAGLSEEQRALRRYFGALTALSQSELAMGSRYWGLKYYNRPDRFPADAAEGLYSFARFRQQGSGMLLVVANFAPGDMTAGRIRVPEELALAAGLPDEVTVTLRLDRTGLRSEKVVTLPRAVLVRDGFLAEVPDQTTLVYEVR